MILAVLLQASLRVVVQIARGVQFAYYCLTGFPPRTDTARTVPSSQNLMLPTSSQSFATDTSDLSKLLTLLTPSSGHTEPISAMRSCCSLATVTLPVLGRAFLSTESPEEK